MYEETKGRFYKHLDFIILDFIVLQASLLLAYTLRHGIGWACGETTYIYMGIALGVCDLGVALLAQSYRDILKRGYLKELRATLIHTTSVMVLTIVLFFLIQRGQDVSRLTVLYIWIGGSILMCTSRLLWKECVRTHIKRAKDVRWIVLVSSQCLVEETMKAIKAIEYRDYRVNKIILVDGENPRSDIMGISVMPLDEAALEYLRTNVVDEIFINLPPHIEVPDDFLEGCYHMGITVHINLMRHPYEIGNKVVEGFAGYTVLTSGMKIASPVQVLLKRSLDILGGLVGTMITGLLTLIIGPIIYLKDPGPIFFSQTRIGKNGRQFKIYKFRSMYMNAEERKKELMAQNEMQGLMFKMTNDPRILPGIGEKIRAWSLDEFPQFINVLKGDMSLIGTRPPTVDEWEQYENHHRKRMAIKPGLTGMWQVSGRSDITDFEEVVALDAQYITEWTLGLDIKILLRTVLVVFAKDGSK